MHEGNDDEKIQKVIEESLLSKDKKGWHRFDCGVPVLKNQLPPVIEDFLKEKNIFPKTSFNFLELKPSVDDLMTKASLYTSVSYFKVEEAGRSGHIIIENQDGDLRIIRNSLDEQMT